MTAAPFLAAATLALPGVAHAFFTRAGGVSEGVYASLNGGVGSRDATEAVAENRARMAAALGLPADRLAVPYQVHSPDAIAISAHWAPDARPRCDGIVTATPGLALGVTGADCGMILPLCGRRRPVKIRRIVQFRLPPPCRILLVFRPRSPLPHSSQSRR